MIRTLIVVSGFAVAMPAFACSPALFERLDVPVRDDADVTRDVAEVQSVEGGEWKIWQGADGSTEEIVRVDYGEMGRAQTRLLIEGPEAYAVTATLYRYSVPIFLEGSMTVRVETDIYMFCDGAVLVPPEDVAAMPDYVEAAEEARSTFRAEEIADLLPVGF